MRLSFLFLMFLPIVLCGQPAEKDAALFSGNDPLRLTIVADIQQLKADTGDYPDDHHGLMLLPGGDTVHIELRPLRDHDRKDDHCSLPLLRVNLRKKEVKRTIFDGQDKLKLVTHCMEDNHGGDLIVKEYLAYRMYGILTAYHFKTRLALITWVDKDRKSDSLTMPAFFVESDNDLAARNDGKIIDIQNIRPQYTEPAGMITMELFQFMIGNTCWSIKALYNVELLAVSGKPPVTVPSGFGYSGFVNAPYARPAPRLPISSVRQRYYTGHCKDSASVDRAIGLFLQHREDFKGLINQCDALTPASRQESADYIDSFYEMLERGEAREIFLTQCRED